MLHLYIKRNPKLLKMTNTPNIPKVYESCIYDQIHTNSDKILSKHQCRICKGYIIILNTV